MNKFENTNTIVNLSNSILKHFGVNVFHSTIKEIDDVLYNKNQVVVLLFDGFGKYIQDLYLKADSFIKSHYLTTINATFPPTTVASTNGFLTGKFPIENGWMSWSQFIDDFQLNIGVFKNARTGYFEILKKRENGLILDEICHNKTICDLINESGNALAFDIKEFPIDKNGPKDLSDSKKIINQLLRENQNCFIYNYITKPDEYIHRYGIASSKVKKYIKNIETFVSEIVNENPNTIFILIADHGLLNVKYLDICSHNDLYSLLRENLSFEKRCVNFYVKSGRHNDFKDLFNRYYGDKFILLSKDEILNLEVFGNGTINSMSLSFLGDFIALSKSEYCLYASKETNMKKFKFLKAYHAGFTDQEMLINVSVFNENRG